MKKIVEKVQSGKCAIKRIINDYILAMAIAYTMLPVKVFAAGGGYTGPLDSLKTILLTLAASAGVIIVCFGIFRLAIAFKKMDQNGEHDALWTMMAGGILIGGSVILGVMGV